MTARPKRAPAAQSPAQPERPERRRLPRLGRPVVTEAERALGAHRGYAKTVDLWPADLLANLTALKRYANNPRINEGAVSEVAASLDAFGAQQPIVVDAAREIIVGDTRLLSALSLRWPRFPVIHAANLTPAEVQAYRIADNKTGERAEWDFPRLRQEFEALRGLGTDLTLTGFRDYELAPLLAANFTPAAPTDETHEGQGRDRILFTPDQWAVVRETCNTLYPDLELAAAVTLICTAARGRDA